MISMSTMPDDEFIKNMPKLELHAHLNGSLKTDTLLELGSLVYGRTTDKFLELCKSFPQNEIYSLEECFKKFPIAHDLTATKDGLTAAVKSVVRDFANDKVIYLELRTTPKATSSMSKSEYLDTILHAIKSTDICANISVKLLPSIDRSKGQSDALETLKIVSAIALNDNSIIRGIDFSGDPTLGNFSDYTEILTKYRKEPYKPLRLVTHCGEIENEREVSEMLEFGMDRCGHGTYLSKKQLHLAREKNITIECCLSSNVKCGTVKTFEDHHFGKLFQAGYPVVLCTDDCGVFDSTLSEEFVIAQKTFNLSKQDLHKLSNTAIEASFADTFEKSYLRKTIDQYFSKD